LPSLRRLGHATRLIVPRGAARLLPKFDNVEELSAGGATTVGAVTIRATEARHAGKRHPFGPAADTLGFIIQGRHTIYFSGDTDLFPEMAKLADQLDVALLPVWGWGPNLGKGHLNPYRAAEALTLLKPGLAIPIHWGTLHPWGIGWLMLQKLTKPPHMFAQYARYLAPDVKTCVVSPGETISVDETLA
jgi:L-ascorbate metabolism protein UlaG (beta-lactamase superfamily)